MFRVVLLGFLIFSVSFVVVSQPVYAISLDDDEEDAEDVADLLSQAKKQQRVSLLKKQMNCLKKQKCMAQAKLMSKRFHNISPKRKKSMMIE